MKSKEALERYYSNLQYGVGGFQSVDEESEALNTFKQDLERLEQLEKENQELKFLLECKSKGNEIIIKKMDLFMKQRDKYVKEYDKLKKAIEILKSVIILPMENDISMIDSKGNNYYILRYVKRLLKEQEYALLKEVLG